MTVSHFLPPFALITLAGPASSQMFTPPLVPPETRYAIDATLDPATGALAGSGRAIPLARQADTTWHFTGLVWQGMLHTCSGGATLRSRATGKLSGSEGTRP